MFNIHKIYIYIQYINIYNIPISNNKAVELMHKYNNNIYAIM